MLQLAADAPAVDRQPGAPEIVELRDTVATLHSRMADIVTPAEAEAIEAVYFAGNRPVDAAEDLQITRQAISLRLNTAMRWLRCDATLAALV